MRNVVLAFASVASLAAVSSIASADPVEASPEPAPGDSAAPSSALAVDAGAATEQPSGEPRMYVQLGGFADATEHMVGAGGTLEVGGRVSHMIWLHAGMAGGQTSELFATGDGSIFQLRVGADISSCHPGDVLCAFVGADVGMQNAQFHGTSDPWFCSEDGGDCMGNPINDMHTGALVAGHVGIDVGGEHVRWRSSLEASAISDGGGGLGVTESLAYRF